MSVGVDSGLGLDLLLPPYPEVEDLEDVEAVQSAVSRLQEMGSTGTGTLSSPMEMVAVCRDGELQCDVVELQGGGSSLRFDCSSSRAMLCLFLKFVEKFCSIDVTVIDSAERVHSLNLSNRRSIASVEGTRAELPLELRDGWNYLCIDLAEQVAAAFGSELLVTTAVEVRGSCSIARAYFQDSRLSITELPKCLTAPLCTNRE